ncbi:hypothetical protein FV139_08595 [Parahaliea maris]|uniref:Thioredoxin domain-containing protein n=1 Tax=Parahaliea maris TaxID=2716870 RepID=A0A5C9A2Y0_9GAMM|nr:hypothetical protein [Parahaliea maris]TXS93691.1 hypothetical protein FV139_08595 [Parahaliea maris]
MQSSESNPEAGAGNNNSRLILLLIAGLPVTMILAATWLWFFVVRGDLDIVGALGTANRGSLVQPPRQLAETGLLTRTGEEFEFFGEEPQWTFVVANPGNRCDSDCEHLLYLTRQIHLALGKEYNRVRRFYLGDTPLAETRLAVERLSDDHPLAEDFPSYMAQEHGKLLPLQGSSANLQALFPERAEAPDTWYLVDPAGWIMMSYDDSVSYKDVIADLKFLLKNSSN